MKKYLAPALTLAALFVPAVTLAAVSSSQPIVLATGWNVVSTPRVLDAHHFSAAETSANFDIYVLDPSAVSGWSTMAQMGQTEFTPLFGYFIDNKTDTNQTLTLDYTADVAPSDRLFERKFTVPGWYSIGVANPTYARPLGSSVTPDTNNPSQILAALPTGSYDTAIDFTSGLFATSPDSHSASGVWGAATQSDINSLNDLRETKAYAIHINTANSLYDGFQNNATATPVVGSATVVDSAAVPAQNITAGVASQTLGGFDVTVAGEPISATGMTFAFATSTTGVGGTGVLTNVRLVDENGITVAGPVDAIVATTSVQSATFVDPVIYPLGTHTFKLVGTVPSNYKNGDTIIAAAVPVLWTLTGEVTGAPIVIPEGLFLMNTMTVKGGAFDITVGPTPAAQNIVPGTTGVLFASIQLDASLSGEDIRISALPLRLTTSGNNIQNNLSFCQVFNGATALNTGSNVVNPTATTTVTLDKNFTFDSTFTLPKGTITTLGVKCNVSASASNGQTYAWGEVAVPSATGVTSSASVTPTLTASAGQVMMIATGSLVIATDASSPSYAIAAANTTGVTLGVAKLHPFNDGVNLQRVGLVLTSGNAQDLVQVTLWNGTTQIGSAIFTGISTHATSTLSTPLNLPKDTDTTITIKGDIAQIGTSQPGGEGDLLQVNVDTNGTNTSGSGIGSGNTINATGSTAFAGVRVFKSYPTLALGTVSTSGMADGKLIRFSVTSASNGPVGIAQFKFNVATTVANVTNVNLFGYTDSAYSSAIVTPNGSGQVASSNQAPDATGALSIITSSPVEVPAAQTRYFELRGTVAGVAPGSSVVTTLRGDSVMQVVPGFMLQVSDFVTSSFLWSPNATTTSSVTQKDWTNGYGLPGLSSTGLIQSRSN